MTPRLPAWRGTAVPVLLLVLLSPGPVRAVPPDIGREQDAADVAPAPQPSFRISASTGFEYYRGDRGGQRGLDESFVVPLAVSLEKGPFDLSVTLPIERAEVVDAQFCVGTSASFRGPCSRFPRLALLMGGTTVTRSSDEWGPGDLQFDLAATWIPESEGPWLPALSPFAGLKLPTGDEDDALGTGSIDTMLGLDASWLLRGGLLPFVSGGYTFVDDEEDLGLTPHAFASAGISWSAPSSRFGLTLGWGWRGPAAEGESDAHEISTSLSVAFGRRLTLEPFGLVGLSRSSPDFGTGARVRASL